MSNTPIFDFIKEYSQKNSTRLHMPGHKGHDVIGIEKYDITEIDGADVLYDSKGIIRESEEIAAGLFGSARTVYSCEGSSLSIRAMLYLAILYGGKSNHRPVILAGRNAHKTFLTASALLDFDIMWMYPDSTDTIISCQITPDHLDEILSKIAEKPVAVYITSPDYLGNMADISGLAKICDKHRVMLICDNAHGAYLAFDDSLTHPIKCGAHMCCDSAHKTLPVLTGGGYLHISEKAPKQIIDEAENAMSIFASTSPSYLILSSLDKVNEYLSKDFKEHLKELSQNVNALKASLASQGFKICGDETLKLTIAPKSYGYTGNKLAEILKHNGIICEFSDPDYVTMMFSTKNTKEDIHKLAKALKNLPQKDEIHEKPPMPCVPKILMTPKECMFKRVKSVPVEEALGKISGRANVSCPPAIPIAVCGEEIGENEIAMFRYYGIDECYIIEE